jgi:mRNA-degrading endonuclease RelE of RelBE toxin-antitoxin system
MKVTYSKRALNALDDAPTAVRKAFFKQVALLVQDLSCPSLHAKKYDESLDVWQARVNKAWRIYFTIAGDTYIIENITPHPK